MEGKLDGDGIKAGQFIDSLPLLNPNRPQVDFSSAKTDYRSEMMRRDLNGKLDGDGIKMGQAVETGITILAPIVVCFSMILFNVSNEIRFESKYNWRLKENGW